MPFSMVEFSMILGLATFEWPFLFDSSSFVMMLLELLRHFRDLRCLLEETAQDEFLDEMADLVVSFRAALSEDYCWTPLDGFSRVQVSDMVCIK